MDEPKASTLLYKASRTRLQQFWFYIQNNLCYVSNSSVSTRGLSLLLDKKKENTKENTDIIIALEE